MSYASRSISTKENLLVDLRNILSEARDFNFLNEITGVLYFANGYFFQYLEGGKESLELLIEKLKKDPRHTDLNFFAMKSLEKRNLDDWSMKYVKRTSAIQDYLSDCKIFNLDPQSLNQQQADTLIDMLIHQENCIF